MARKVIHQLVDDLTGDELKPGEGETVLFSLDGKSYEIDLSEKNAEKLRKALQPFIDAGRKTTGSARSGRGSGSGSNREELAAARTWLRENGHEVSDRGRIPGELMELYRNSK